jgi:hypothetical protein
VRDKNSLAGDGMIYKLELGDKLINNNDLFCKSLDSLDEHFEKENGKHCVVRATVIHDGIIKSERVAKCEYIMAIDRTKAKCLLNGCLKYKHRANE